MNIQTPIGALFASFYQDKLSGLSFTPPAQSLDEAAEPHPLLQQLQAELQEYFNGTRKTFNIPLHFNGSSFQNQVWTQLLQIPYGQTCSYAELAFAVDNPKACRAIGTANSRNPIAIIIPCHRVINADKRIGGYSGEIWRKRYLLELEDCVFRI